MGRVIINIWRVARQELKLTNYGLEEIVFHYFGIREPVFHNWQLTQWFNKGGDGQQLVISYYIRRIFYLEKVLEELETIPRTAEATRLFGCEFESIVSIADTH